MMLRFKNAVVVSQLSFLTLIHLSAMFNGDGEKFLVCENINIILMTFLSVISKFCDI